MKAPLIGVTTTRRGSGFLIGVQWNPELLPFSPPQRRTFAALAEAARIHGSASR